MRKQLGSKLKELKESRDTLSLDSVITTKEDIFNEALENNVAFMTLFSIIQSIMSSEDGEVLEDIIMSVTDSMSDEDADMYFFYLEKLLNYVRVPASTIEDLLSEDNEISKQELENVKELIDLRIGDIDISKFITYALGNPELPDSEDADLDDATFDWAFFGSKDACKNGDGEREVPKSKNQSCSKGFSKGKLGFWRYPKGDFPNDSYKLKDGGTRERGKTIKNLVGSKPHSTKAEKSRRISMNKRKKNTMSTFGGYTGKAKKLDVKNVAG